MQVLHISCETMEMSKLEHLQFTHAQAHGHNEQNPSETPQGGGKGGVSVSSMLPKKKASGFGGGEERCPKQPEGFKGEKKKKQMEFPMQTVQKLRGLRNKATNDSEEGAKKGRSERRRLSDCFSQAGPCSHLLSSFKGVVMVTVVGTQMWLRG